MKSVATRTALICALAFTLLPTPVSAEERLTDRVERPMKIVDFDPAIAEQNGFKIVALKDGSEISIQQGLYREGLSDEELLALASASTVPQGQLNVLGEVRGDCGRSWIYLNRAGQLIGEVWLGFEVNSPAVAYNAQYLLSEDDNDPTAGFTSDSGYEGPLRLETRWDHREYEGVPVSRLYVAEVQTMNAFLANGGLCASGLPADSEFLF